MNVATAPDAAKAHNSCSIIVHGLAPHATTDLLTEHFSQTHPVRHAVAVLDPTSNKCRGFGFVTFADADDTKQALQDFNGSQFLGQKLHVKSAWPRKRIVQNVVAAMAEGPKRQEAFKPQKLIVRNLPWNFKKPEQLEKLFQPFGKVLSAVIPPGKKPGLSPGYGFVLVRGRKNTEKALREVNGKVVDGRTLAVDYAIDKGTWQNSQHSVPDGGDENNVEGNEGQEDEETTDEEDELEIGDGGPEDEGGPMEPPSDSDGHVEAGESDEDDDEMSKDDFSDPLEDDEEGMEEEDAEREPDRRTLFIRNVPFTATDDSLEEHFSRFGPIHYARVVVDQSTLRPKGTAFVAFERETDALACLKGAPKVQPPPRADTKDTPKAATTHSVLENSQDDPSGLYVMEGRVLQTSQALSRSEAARRAAQGVESRLHRDKDKRNLYLLSEGTIYRDSPLYETLSPSEIRMREASVKQRRQLIQSNPSLHLSLTRLAVRNIPRGITTKDLKSLARKAVVGFACDVKLGKREPLSKEELSRGAEAMVAAEKDRKSQGKGQCKQAKVVFETEQGSKVGEGDGGRSRGYGFIEYFTHRSAIMGLRWLNGHPVAYKAEQPRVKGKRAVRQVVQDRKKRLVVEFAIENAQVVARRRERENKARARAEADRRARISGRFAAWQKKQHAAAAEEREPRAGSKRKRDADALGEDDDGDSADGRPAQVHGKGAKGTPNGRRRGGSRGRGNANKRTKHDPDQGPPQRGGEGKRSRGGAGRGTRGARGGKAKIDTEGRANFVQRKNTGRNKGRGKGAR